MFAKLFFTLALWVSTLFPPSPTTKPQVTIPEGSNPFSVEYSKIFNYLEDNPTLELNSNVVFIDKDEDYKLAHLMGKIPVDLRYRERPVVDESTTQEEEEVQAKLETLKSEFPNQSDVALLSILGDMNETVKVSN